MCIPYNKLKMQLKGANIEKVKETKKEKESLRERERARKR